MAKTNDASRAKLPETPQDKAMAKMTWDEFRALIERAKKGDRKSLPLLREALISGDYPNWSQRFLNQYGSPAEWLRSSLATWVGGETNLAVQEAAEGKMDQLRKELEGSDPTAMERLLAERAVTCWFMFNMYETVYNQSKELTIRQAEFQLRRIESAHKRFLSAVSTLARVRKLALPAIQVNLAHQQVNLSS